MSGYQMYCPRKVETNAVFEEFSQLSDMIWKLPRFLENETRIEREKLDKYFPVGDPHAAVLRTLRWSLEGEKLFGLFPRLLNQTGVLLAVALFETRLVHAVNTALAPSRPADDLKACQQLLKDNGLDLEQLRFANQVKLALLVRHCIIHLSGYVDHLRKKDALLAGIEEKDYLQHWQIAKGSEAGNPWLSIEADRYGMRLVISHTYAFVTCSLLRDNLCELLDHL